MGGARAFININQPQEGGLVHAPHLALSFWPVKYCTSLTKLHSQCQIDIWLAGTHKCVWTFQRHNFRDVSSTWPSTGKKESETQMRTIITIRTCYVSFRALVFFAILSLFRSHIFVSILKPTHRIIYICQSCYLLQRFLIIKPGVCDVHGQDKTHMTNISVWQLKDKRGLTIPSCSLIQSLVSLGMHYYFLSSFSIDRPGLTSRSISQWCWRLYACLLLHLAPLSSLYPSLCHPLIDAPLPIYTSAPALTPINYLASLS